MRSDWTQSIWLLGLIPPFIPYFHIVHVCCRDCNEWICIHHKKKVFNAANRLWMRINDIFLAINDLCKNLLSFTSAPSHNNHIILQDIYGIAMESYNIIDIAYGHNALFFHVLIRIMESKNKRNFCEIIDFRSILNLLLYSHRFSISLIKQHKIIWILIIFESFENKYVTL